MTMRYLPPPGPIGVWHRLVHVLIVVLAALAVMGIGALSVTEGWAQAVLCFWAGYGVIVFVLRVIDD